MKHAWMPARIPEDRPIPHPLKRHEIMGYDVVYRSDNFLHLAPQETQNRMNLEATQQELEEESSEDHTQEQGESSTWSQPRHLRDMRLHSSRQTKNDRRRL